MTAEDQIKAFLTQLVCNLLDEGNTVFREGDCRQAAVHYSEGVSVARYAQTEALVIPAGLLESLYVNRAAAHHSIGEYERGVQDCDSALAVCEGSRKALYRKALCLRDLGRLREAYECSTGFLLITPHDRQVSDLAQDLASKLGLKIRKAYVSPQMTANGLDDISADLSTAQCIPAPLATPIPVSDEHSPPSMAPAVSQDLPESPSQGMPGVPYSVPVSEQLEECDSLLDCLSKGAEVSVTSVQGAIPTNLPNPAVGLRSPYISGLPAPSSQLPPTLYSSPAVGQLGSLDSFSGRGTGDTSTQALDAMDPYGHGASTMGTGGGGLDSLSEFTLPGGRISHNFIPELRNHGSNHTVRKPNYYNSPSGTNLSLLSRNPLAATHEFRQACHACYSRIGPRVMDYQYQPDAAHRCKRDVLLCRLKGQEDLTWKRIRPRPAQVQERQECKYGENCTFAYCQEEIDECYDSKPRIISKRSKENLAVCSNLTARHPFDDNKCLVHVVRSANVRYSKVRPLHPLCQFDVCRHEVRYGCQREDSCSFAHSVIELKCWVLQQDTGITHEEMVQESKRHWHRLEQNAQRQKGHQPMHVPHQNSRGGGNDGIGGGGGGGGGGGHGHGGGEIGGGGGMGGGGGGRARGLNLKMKFVCGQCWRDGQVNEPDKSLKYCTAKARHSWTKERRVLLVKSFEKKKWVVVRPLPFSRTYPQQYDMCVHVMKQKKCHYIGNCSFAHSLEERDVWTYMKNNSLGPGLHFPLHQSMRVHANQVCSRTCICQVKHLCVCICLYVKMNLCVCGCTCVYLCVRVINPSVFPSVRDMQQMYDMWLALTNQNRRPDGSSLTPPPDEKQIAMPPDYAEPMAGQRLSGQGEL
ncbi:hypothetical protein JZ751_025281 [Albula glossodonta]|uniref:C3H1-type domain-containing protein n=1 Tax=Albula glossodonta TaxID=121402 RepID=A0A8T2NMJ1_9TELE|nr:hypothetical protein JZ751_025281 [Albula glossodonta]